MRSRSDGGEQISRDEPDALRERLREDRAAVTTLQDVAEVTGLSLEEVAQHLERLRAERAVAAGRPSRSWAGTGIVVIAVIALGLGAMVVWQRSQKPDSPLNEANMRPMPPLVSPGVLTTRSTDTRSRPATHMPSTDQVTSVPGFRVVITSQRTAVEPSYAGTDSLRMPYAQAKEGLVRSLIEAGRYAVLQDAQNQSELKPPLADSHGNTIYPEPGKVFYSIESWAGLAKGKFAVPITPAGRAELESEVEKLLATVYREQKAALDLRVNPRKDAIVLPPPGFDLTVHGRRSDRQEGPRWAFDRANVDTVIERMALAIENGVFRDALPPKGRWVGAPPRVTSAPKMYRAEIEGPGGLVAFDFPNRASRGDLRRRLEPLKSQIRTANAAVRSPIHGKP